MLELIPPERAVSIEREVFPELIGDGLYGIRLEGYWIDIGTPERFLEANWDILERRVETVIGERLDETARWWRKGSRLGSRYVGWSGGDRGADRDFAGRAAASAVRARPGVGSSRRSIGALRAARRLHGRGRALWSSNSILGGGVTVGVGAELDGDVIAEGDLVERPGAAAERRADESTRDGDRGRHAGRGHGRMPDHLRDALWRIETARAATMEAPAAFVCGMGGSAIGGDLAVAALADRLDQADARRPAATSCPSWAPAGSAVLCSSYSGNTEETLACYAAAEALGAQRLVATTGGELAEAARARRRARDRPPGGPAAPGGGRLHVLRRRRARGAGAGRAPHPHRDRRRRLPPRARPSTPPRSAPREIAG